MYVDSTFNFSAARRTALLLLALLVVTCAALAVASASAKAAITPAPSAGSLASAMADGGSFVGAADYVVKPPEGVPAAVSDTSLTGFPLSGGNYAVLSTGDATLAAEPNTEPSSGVSAGGDPDPDGTRGDNNYDTTILRVPIMVPSGSNCLGFTFRFLSEEYPEFVNKNVNDAFIAELDTNSWSAWSSDNPWTDDPEGNDGGLTAPANFAKAQNGKPITVDDTGPETTTRPSEAAGTTYDAATPALLAQTPVTPGLHHLYLSIFDQGDAIYDSAVFVDRLTLTNDANCNGSGEVQKVHVSFSVPECQDRIDNDGDGLVDSTGDVEGNAGPDPECDGPSDNSERDTTPPTASQSGPGVVKAKAILAKGFVTNVYSSEAGSATCVLTVSKKVAKRLKLPRKLGSGSTAVAAGEPANCVAKLTKKAKAAIKRAFKKKGRKKVKSIKATLTTTVTDQAGNSSKVKRGVTIKR